MKFCSDCGNSVPENSATCSSCGKDQRTVQPISSNNFTKQQPVQGDDTFLKVLCILTIVGASIGLLSAALTFGIVSVMDNEHRIIQMIAILAASGKMTGAILMLQKRLTGLYIYTVAAIVNISLTVAMAFGFNMIPKDQAVPKELLLISVIIGVAISGTFLIMYWLKMNRRLLG